MIKLEEGVREAVKHFWATRLGQAEATEGQGGGRDAVVGGAQMDGFVYLVKTLLAESGLPEATIYHNRRSVTLPGFFRPTKNWDLIAIDEGKLIASLEFKSQVGSFGNNYNNRTEEAIGNATDLWTAYRDGALQESPRPWLGWLMLVEDCDRSNAPVGVSEPFFNVFEEFRGASYIQRYTLLCQKLVRERLYDGACLLVSDRAEGLDGNYSEPSEEVGFRNFAASLMAKASAFARTRKQRHPST